MSRLYRIAPTPLDRRQFLSSTALTVGASLLTAPVLLPSATAQAADAVDLPMIEKASTDASLPGTWHILDRSKPVRKLIDRKSLLPVGRPAPMMIEVSAPYVFAKKAAEAFWLLGLPADIGDEQTLLGCLPSFTPEKGPPLKYKVEFHQAQGAGCRVAQFAVQDIPQELKVTFSVKCVLLNPPVLTPGERALATQAFLKRQGKAKDRQGMAGFPNSRFPEGGPAYIGAEPSPNYVQTINNVLKKVESEIPHSGNDVKFFTFDPEVAKANKKGNCTARSVVGEKALVGVARSCAVGIWYENGGTSHALLLIEDPESGAYFVVDQTSPTPTYMPHPGYMYITGPFRNQGIPNPFKLPFSLEGSMTNYFYTREKVLKAAGATQLTGSSNPGFFKDYAKYQAWLKKVPGEFRDLEKQLLKK